MSHETVEAAHGVRTDLSVGNTGAGGHRRLDERFYLRFPTVFRLILGDHDA
jgi:hypothetical protein